ncbi:hypothetical protein [Haloarcula marina]|uniref:hypothetical protein n=1 Tax=Haloarcula marina TaxID=2961574 RepID=UPI0020B67D5F|nr:hypothetical protein [Halomicroarcula marina]
MRRLLAVALVVLAGCSGVFADDGRPTETAPVTAAPVPETPPAPVTLPQSEDGTPAVGQIVIGHHRTVSERTLHRRVVTGGGETAVDVWVDREADVARVQRRYGNSTTDTVVADGVRYERGVERQVETSIEVPYVETASGLFFLQQLVSGLVYNRTGTVTRNGERLAVVSANTTNSTISRSAFRTVVAADSRLYVDRRGGIRYVDHRERYADGTVRTVRMRVRTDIDRVPIPPWLDGTAVYG